MMQMDTAINILEQISTGKTHIGEYLSLIFQNLPVGIFWKDFKSNYLGANRFHAYIAGLDDEQDIIGLTDFELCWKEIETIGFRADDEKIIQTGLAKTNFTEVHHRRDGEVYCVNCTKLPIYDHVNQTVSVLGLFTDAQFAQYMCHISSQQMIVTQNNYYLTIGNQTIRLTARQAECLTHLSMGKTIKQIASMLSCSSRTIEDHINLLKRKLGVYSTAELIDFFWRNPIKWF